MKLKRNLPPIIASALLSIALSILVLRNQYLSMPLWLTAALAIGFSCLLGILMTYPKAGLAVLALMLAGAGVFWWLADESLKAPVIQFAEEGVNYITGSEIIPLAYPRMLAALHIFAVSCVCTLLAVLLPGTVVLGLLSFAYIILQWLLGDEVLPEAALAAVALLVLCLHGFERKGAKLRGEKPTGRLAVWALPLCLVIVALSYSSVTVGEIHDTWRWYSKTVHMINDYFNDYTSFQSPRSKFSIASAGFQPLGDRLGGPLKLENTPILAVESQYPVLLRGNIKNEYTGTSWKNTMESSRYRLNNDAYSDLRTDVFDLARPDPELFESYIQYLSNDIEIRITHLSSTGSTIFTPYRVDNVRPVKAFTILPFYNDEGEVFSSRSIQPGMSYRVYSPYLSYDRTGFAQLMDAVESGAPAQPGEKTAILEQYYMGLPDSLPDIVEQTTQSVVAGIQGDYQKALAIQEYLEENFRYTIIPDVVPEGADFVSYFLETREGYCTYFASAMAIMARQAGLPSRYVEGFRADGGPRRAPQVLEARHAHAWAELYFEGFGWLPFDATPDGGSDSLDGSGGPGLLPEDMFPFESPTPDMAVDWDDTGYYAVKRYTWIFYILGAIIAGLAGLGTAAYLRNAQFVLQRRYAGDLRKIAAHYYMETIWLLNCYNRTRKPGQTLTAYGRQTDEWLSLECGKFSKMADIISMMVYAGITPSRDDVQWMALFRRRLAKRTLKSAGLPRFFYRQAILMRHIKNEND